MATVPNITPISEKRTKTTLQNYYTQQKHVCSSNITMNTVTHPVFPNVQDSKVGKFNREQTEVVQCIQLIVRQIKRHQLWNILHDDIQHCQHHVRSEQRNGTIVHKICKHDYKLATKFIRPTWCYINSDCSTSRIYTTGNCVYYIMDDARFVIVRIALFTYPCYFNMHLSPRSVNECSLTRICMKPRQIKGF